MTTAASDLRWDPYDTVLDTSPYEVWKRMRDEAPVYYNEALNFYALSRYADVSEASRDIATFSSAYGTVLESMGNDMSGGGLMIFMDPPNHTVLRQLVSRAFTPRRMNELEAPIRAICAEYLDPQVGGSGFDYLAEFGMHLPSRVISALLGVPADEREYVLNLINTIFTIDAENGMNNPTSMAAMGGIYEWIGAAVAQRRGKDGDDMLSVIANVDRADDGTERKLTDQEACAFGILLVTAGTETVARLLGWTSVVLAEHADQRAELVANPALIPNAVEELLRYEAPSPVNGRMVMRDVELHGQTIPEGAKVLMLTGSAGRDEREYPDADRFDIHRKFEQHVTFGVGPHYCLGAALARMEGRIALEETLKRFPTWDVDHDNVVRLHTSTVRGHKNVPITLP